MHPILFNLGPFSVHAFGFAIAIAFLLGILLSFHFAKKDGIDKETVLDFTLWVIIAAIVGARFLYVIGTWDQYQANIWEIFMVQRGGLVFLGGLLAAIVTLVYLSRRSRIPILRVLDVATPAATLGYAIGRLGCFLNGCCFGLPTKLPWGIQFPFGSLAHSYYPHDHLHPTQLVSAASMFIAFAIVVWLYQKKKYDGYIFYWGLIMYSVYRFLIEFLRFSPIHWLGLTPSQWLVVFAGGYAVWGLMHKRFKS